MIRMINKLTGTVMYVEESRKGEYLAAGHKLVNISTPKAPRPQEETPEPKEPESKLKKTIAKVKAKTTAKTTRKKG